MILCALVDHDASLSPEIHSYRLWLPYDWRRDQRPNQEWQGNVTTFYSVYKGGLQSLTGGVSEAHRSSRERPRHVGQGYKDTWNSGAVSSWF